MKQILLSTALATALLIQPVMAADKAKPGTETVAKSEAQDIHVGVNGMVCDFCAQALKKTFAKKANIPDVDISLEKKLVTLHVPAGQTIDDATITKLITDAGYAVTNIHRM